MQFSSARSICGRPRKPDGTEATDEQFEAAIQQIIAIGRKTGTPTGMHIMDPAVALERARQGMQFIAVGSELRFMTERAQQVLGTLHPDGKQKDLVRY